MAHDTQYAILMYSLGIEYSLHPVKITEKKKKRDEHTRINRSLANIPNSSALHHVPHSETLDGFILWDCTRAVGTADESDMATTLLVTATVSSFLGLRTTVQLVSLRIEEVIQVHDKPSTLHLNCPRVQTTVYVRRKHITVRTEVGCTHHA
jgi:hypothetical protein